MNVIWFLRWEKLKWIMRLGALHDLRERNRVRRELLATPGVDHLVVSVMDMRYGKHGWRVSTPEGSQIELLEAQVSTRGQGKPWWGPIGPLRSINTRKWLTSVWMEHKGVSHAKPPEPPHPYVGPHDYIDTEPQDDDGRTSR